MRENRESLFYFLGLQKSLQAVTTGMKLKDPGSVEGKLTNLDSILRRKDITLQINVHIVKVIVFPVVMYGRERWTIKKAEH